ncbi:hypothetical protein L5515_000524 [Caenorhabditis briggsae]|uniref:Uncharacterized protein n=2 Tax=Caenorhabditis briggsae TaxID=6238 RepID=A0AAE9E088_CAEBR|nr:hypothetical protein L5515_000524 [Caenorhabditis briggsae]
MQKQGLGRYRSQNSSETSQNLIANTEKYLGEKLNKMKDSAPKKNDVKGGDASQRLPKKHVCQKSHNSSEQSDKILVNHRSVKAKFCNLQRDNKKFFWNSNQKGRRSQASSSQPTKDLSCKAPTVPVIKDVQVEKTKVTPIHDQRKVIFLEENLFKKTPEKLETETAEPISVSQLETETTHSDMPSLPLSEATSHNVSVNANFVIESSEEILNNNPSSGKQVEDFTEVLENRAPTEKLPSPPLSEAASQNVSVNANFVFESFEGINNNAFPSDRQVEDVIQVLGNQASTENVCIEEKIELQAIGQTSNATGDIELCTERAVFATTYVASNSNRYKSIEMDLFKDKNDNHVLKTPPKAVKKPDSFIRTPSSGKSSIYCQLSPKVCSFAPKPVKERVPNQKLSISAMIDEMKKKNATEKINSYMMFLPEAFSDGTLTESTVKNLYGNFDVEVVKSHYNLNGERLGSGTISVPGNCHERIQNWAPDRKWRAIRMGLLKQRETSGTKVKLYLKLSGEWTPIKIVRFQTCLQDSYHVSDFTLIYDFNGLFAKAVTVFMAYENAQQLQKSFELSETMEPNLRVKILEILESSDKIHVQHKKF